MSPTVEVRDGTVRLPAALVAAHFAGVEAVVVLIRAGAIEILPVRHMEAGGCLLKQRTRAGDRVASAPDVFRRCGLGEWRAEALPACWSPAKGALVVALPEAAK
jgi:hypothetical protein